MEKYLLHWCLGFIPPYPHSGFEVFLPLHSRHTGGENHPEVLTNKALEMLTSTLAGDNGQLFPSLESDILKVNTET